MDFVKADCFPGTPLWVYATFWLLLLLGLVLVWNALRPPRRPEWSITGRRRNR